MNDFVVRKANQADTQDFDWGTLTWYASGRLGNCEQMTVGRCVLKPGRANPPHSHPNCEEVLHVLGGRIRHCFGGGESEQMQAGDTVTVRPGVRHWAENVGREDAHLLIAFSAAERETLGE